MSRLPSVIVPPPGYWAEVQRICRRHDILLIADEVICGFGRTGSMFGSETYGIKPDILTCAKALSSSYLPISAVAINEAVYEVLAANTHKIGMFGHGRRGSGDHCQVRNLRKRGDRSEHLTSLDRPARGIDEHHLAGEAALAGGVDRDDRAVAHVDLLVPAGPPVTPGLEGGPEEGGDVVATRAARRLDQAHVGLLRRYADQRPRERGALVDLGEFLHPRTRLGAPQPSICVARATRYRGADKELQP